MAGIRCAWSCTSAMPSLFARCFELNVTLRQGTCRVSGRVITLQVVSWKHSERRRPAGRPCL